MINPQYVNEFIKALPNIFIYIVPGYLFIQVFNYVLNWKTKDLTKNILGYIIASFIICSLTEYILSLKYNEVIITLPNVILSILAASILSGYIFALFFRSDLYDVFRKFLKINRTINSNIFYDIIDRTGTWARVYLKDEKIVYFGSIRMFEQKEKYNDGFLVLNNYTTYCYGESTVYQKRLPKEEKSNSFVSIKVSEISRIETIYNENSKFLFNLLQGNNKSISNLLGKIKIKGIIQNINNKILQ